MIFKIDSISDWEKESIELKVETLEELKNFLQKEGECIISVKNEIETVKFNSDDFTYAKPESSLLDFELRKLNNSPLIRSLVEEVKDSHNNSWFGGFRKMDLQEFGKGYLEGYLTTKKDIMIKLVLAELKSDDHNEM